MNGSKIRMFLYDFKILKIVEIVERACFLELIHLESKIFHNCLEFNDSLKKQSRKLFVTMLDVCG